MPTTPLFTRHTRGSIEADRDGRRLRRGRRTVRYHAEPHEPALRVLEGGALAAEEAQLAAERWADEGGSLDREAAAVLR